MNVTGHSLYRVVKRPSELNVKTIKEEGSAILRVNCEAVVAHRTILSDISPFFYTMFYGSFRENKEFFVDLTHIFQTSENLTNIINFMFGADISVTETNVSDLLAAAEFLAIPEIKVQCFEFLLKNLSLQNCLWTWSLADLYSLEGLDEICQEIAISRFHDCLINHEDTYFCPPEYMITFLNKGLAMLCSRKDIKTFIDKYVQSDDNHQRFKNELQKCARKSKEMGKVVNENLDEEADYIIELPEHVPSMQRNVFNESKVKDQRGVETTTECLIYQENKGSFKMKQGSFAMYSPVFGKWYRLELPSFDFREGGELVSVGLGVDNNLLLLKDNCEKLILYEITTNKIRPVLPLTKHSTLTYKAELFCSISQVYCLSYRYYGTRGRSKTKIKLHKYEMKTNKWERLCNVEASKEPIYYPVHIFQHINETYIFVLKPTRIDLYQFCGCTEKIQRLGQFIPKTESESEFLQSRVYRSPTKLGLESESMTVIYDLEMDTWEVNKKTKFPSINKIPARFDVISNTRKEGYSVSSGCLDSVVHFTVIKGGTETRLPTLPSLSESSLLSIVRVPWKLLEILKSPESKIETEKPLCTRHERISIQDEYRRKHLPPGNTSTVSETDTEKNREDTEEYDFYS